MNFDDILDGGTIVAGLKATSKKQLFQELAQAASPIVHLPQQAIFDAVTTRERLGSTGVGGGVAIPHARLDKLEHIAGVFARLDTPIDFDGVDDTPVDLVFLLLAPDGAGGDHLKALARVSRALRRSDFRDRLRDAANADALRALLTGEQQTDAA